MVKSKLFLLLIFGTSVLAADQAYGNRPRGVSAEKAALYEERDEFKCLDGSKNIPFAQVNDDYCDCADGSDEPGTSACNNGRFHCRNYGHRALEVPSSRVNDHICDCCDGSDEWDSEVQCPNVCKEMGAQARKDLDQHRDLVERGYAKRLELAKEGAKSMEEKKVEVEKMKKELEDLQPIKIGIEASKNDAEQKENDAKGEEDKKWNEIVEHKRKQESNDYFVKTDSDKDGKTTIEEFKEAVKKATNYELLEHEITGIFGDQLDIVGDKFHEKLTEIRRFFRIKQTTESPPTTTPSLPDASELDAEEEESDDNLEPEETTHEDEPEEQEDKKPDYNEVTTKLIEEANKFRDQFRDTSNKIQDLEISIRDAENFLQFEYGPDYAWAPLKGQCPEINQAQYTYRLCLFDRAVQKDRNGHHEVGLGNWRGWEGPDDSKYAIQKYADGQQCWNGPARSTIVHVECGEELEVYDVKEPAKCEYELHLKSPAACPDPQTLKDPFAVHTEL